MKLKIIKFKAFDKNNTKGTVYTVAYKGRVFNVSSLDFDAEQLVVKDDVLTITCDVERISEPFTNELGQLVVGQKLKQRMDIPKGE